MKPLLAAAASLMMLAAPSAAQAALFTYEADYCVHNDPTITVCNDFVLVIDTVNHTGTYTEEGNVGPLTWVWDADIQGAIITVDASAVRPDIDVRLMAFLDGPALVGAMAVADTTGELILGRFDAVRVPTPAP